MLYRNGIKSIQTQKVILSLPWKSIKIVVYKKFVIRSSKMDFVGDTT